MKNISTRFFCFSLATILKRMHAAQSTIQVVKVTGANAGSNRAVLNNKLFLLGTEFQEVVMPASLKICRERFCTERAQSQPEKYN
ncbi:MAG: hypothetical protein QM534_19245 [Sediminibacterium sp.]|nr:hypothetical protein [Sediminibacterium sp.]